MKYSSAVTERVTIVICHFDIWLAWRLNIGKNTAVVTLPAVKYLSSLTTWKLRAAITPPVGGNSNVNLSRQFWMILGITFGSTEQSIIMNWLLCILFISDKWNRSDGWAKDIRRSAASTFIQKVRETKWKKYVKSVPFLVVLQWSSESQWKGIMNCKLNQSQSWGQSDIQNINNATQHQHNFE